MLSFETSSLPPEPKAYPVIPTYATKYLRKTFLSHRIYHSHPEKTSESINHPLNPCQPTSRLSPPNSSPRSSQISQTTTHTQPPRQQPAPLASQNRSSTQRASPKVGASWPSTSSGHAATAASTGARRIWHANGSGIAVTSGIWHGLWGRSGLLL